MSTKKGAVLAVALALAFAAPAAAEPVQMKFAFPAPAGSWVNVGGVTPWSREVERDAAGTIEIKLFPGPALANFNNAFDRVVNGVAEMAFGTVGNVISRAKTEVSNLPYVADDSHDMTVALWRLYSRGITASDFEKVKPLAIFTFSSSNLHTNRPVRSGHDLKGLKIASAGKIGAQALDLLGAAPVTMTPPETYLSISRGLVAGTTMSWPGVTVFKLQEVAQHHLEVNFGQAPAFIFMNKDAFARLPEKARDAIDRHSNETLTRRLANAAVAADKAVLGRLQAMPGQTFHELAPEEVARWKRVLAPIVDEWVKETPDGARVLAEFKSEVAKSHAERQSRK
jgi:TRAP-type C4-dicarboxylate transport system substrate-binding protein